MEKALAKLKKVIKDQIYQVEWELQDKDLETNNRIVAERMNIEIQATDMYLDTLQSQQDITDLYLEIIGG